MPDTYEFLIRSVDTDKREVSGIAVPWETEIDLWGMREKFERGAVVDSDDAQLFWQHREPIGKLTSASDGDAGWEIKARISETPRGNEAYTLVRDGVIDRFSIGFEPLEWRDEKADDGSITRTMTRVRVREVSLVSFPAYDDARLTDVRSAPTTHPERTDMPPETETPATEVRDLSELRERIEDLERLGAAMGAAMASERGAATDEFRSIGDMVKRIASGDDKAIRAYEGAIAADTVMKDSWLGSLVEIVKKRRPILGLFSTGPLPATGMGVEYAVLKEDATDVAEQEAEGDDLAFGKVSIDVERAGLKTFGGWSSLSRQAIERASVGILDTTWEAMVEKYARATELYARSVLMDAWRATDDAALAEVTADLTTQDGIIAAVLDLIDHFEATGRNLDGILLDRATFLGLYAVPATDRVLQITGQPADKAGTLTITKDAATGAVVNLPVRYLPGSPAGFVTAYDATAIKTLESAGAPWRLQDENVVNLSKDFSLYGYASSFVQKPAGLVKVTQS